MKKEKCKICGVNYLACNPIISETEEICPKCECGSQEFKEEISKGEEVNLTIMLFISILLLIGYLIYKNL